MTSNNNNELFPDVADPKRKLRGFSRVDSVPPTSAPPTKQPPKKQAEKRRAEVVEPVQQNKVKRVIVKGYGDASGQNQREVGKSKGQQEQDKEREVSTTNTQATNNLPSGTSLTTLTTIEESQTDGTSGGQIRDPTGNQTAAQRKNQEMPESESSLEYLEDLENEEDSDSEVSWVNLKQVKKEPDEGQREKERRLTGLVASPSLNKVPNPPPKVKPARAAERKIPRGRPMSEDEDDNVNKSRGRGFVENGIEFAEGEVPSHHMAQLTVFWDNRIRKIKGYVPVSMFNRAWLEANREVEGKKSKKKKKDEESDSEDETYEGLSYPSELRLSYGDWVTCFNLMLDYLRKWFDFRRLAEKFEGHKKNVEEIKSENDDNWMIALR
ncbi:uncharacterized protein MELLADRAFT_114269 [Melampsora larici-populina 98AG31]|uniref:Uncharacterized protein n=1 Tax=Melampsora larici-populina (strain 98AG31 / pathotype 3-4-7) TaxID=747676 RepID=F4SCV1_MELLP|nr:uncharacterized protein MELLADRAFT_114269 [Melampsora larici-populina 98AG31]EGF97530.1 hypothetical protein MELLADRAFT_114269 [Melampsora larici-populina 98AG31]